MSRSPLAVRLRTETAALHRQTEEQAGVPGRIGTVAEYVQLLECMLVFHLTVERSLGDARWASEWRNLGVVVAAHDRSQLIVEDLRALGSDCEAEAVPEFSIASFAEALGCLYVVEGSSLGGRFIGPAIVERLGQLPTAYYDGDGRGHPAPWRSLQAALAAYDASAEDADRVVAGAVDTFTLFGTILQSRVTQHESV